jgi:recombination associated protein RdgC
MHASFNLSNAEVTNMWFKNIQLFRLSPGFQSSAEELNEKLQALQIQPCGKTQPFRFGWASPFDKNNPLLVHAGNGYWLFCAAKEERLLPGSVIRDTLSEKVEEIELNQNRKVSSKEKARLKEEIIFDLLPKAFTKRTHTFAYIDPSQNWLILDTMSSSKTSAFIELLQKSLGSLSLLPAVSAKNPKMVMTDWLLHNHSPSPFTIESDCEMLDTKSNAIIKCQGEDLSAKAIHTHLQEGKHVVNLAMSWQGKIAFVLCDNLIIKRIRFLDLLREQHKEVSVETRMERLDADFALMTAEFNLFLRDLFHLLGGLEPLGEMPAGKDGPNNASLPQTSESLEASVNP